MEDDDIFGENDDSYDLDEYGDPFCLDYNVQGVADGVDGDEDSYICEDDWFDDDISREYTYDESKNLLKNIPLKHVEKYIRDIKLKNIKDVQDR